MKTSLWNILTIFLILAIFLVVAGAVMIFYNPAVPMNPFPPATEAPSVFVPSSTPTVAALPPTWTSTANPVDVVTQQPRASSTPLPTRTPFILPSPTDSPALVMPTNTRLPLEGRCKVTEQEPEDGTQIKIGSEFRTTWILQNTGETEWVSSDVDVRYKEGSRLHTGPSVADLYQTIAPGGTADISITMKAPDTEGYYITYWTITQGDQSLCTFYVEIFAKK